MIFLNKSKLAEAKKFLEIAHQEAWRECTVCKDYGRFGPIQECPNCDDRRVYGVRANFYSVEQLVDYWQARALVAECGLEEVCSSRVASASSVSRFSCDRDDGKPFAVRVRYQDCSEERARLFPTLCEARGYCEKLYNSPLGSSAMYFIHEGEKGVACLKCGKWEWA